jgi:outer membrane receptor protein involved in Fe transport/ABC-type uncharacterized transport system substrate-binding protein
VAAEPPPADTAREFGFLEAEDVEKIPLGVVSRGPAIPAGLAPAVVDVIPAEEIRTTGARTLAELLAQRVGMDVSIDRVVPRGLNTVPAIPGLQLFNNRTLLLIDGRPTNGLFFGEFLAGRELPLDYIERIEIVRGPGSALYGTNAMAGVINVVTKDAADEPGIGASAEYGSFSERRADLFGGIGRPELSGNFFLRYYGDGGTDQITRNDNRRQFFGFARGTVGPVTLEGEAQNFRQENPGLVGAPSGNDRTNRELYSASARLDQPLGEQFRILGRVYANVYQNRLLIEETAGTTPDRAVYDERRIAEELALTYRPRQWLSVTLGGEVRQEHGTVGPGHCTIDTGPGELGLSPTGCTLDQTVAAAFLEDQIQLPYDFTLTAGVRYDDVSISGDRINPRANLLWKAGPRTSVKVGYGEAFRAPSFFELRGAQEVAADTFVLGNPNLQPEVVKTIEGEIDHSFARWLNVRLSAFHTTGKDMITARTASDLVILNLCPPPGMPPNALQALICPVFNGLAGLPLPITTTETRLVNSDEVTVTGLEAAFGGAVGPLPVPGEISYGVNYTFQETNGDFRDPATGAIQSADLPLAPAHKLNVLVDYRPVRDLSLFWHTRWVDEQFAAAPSQRPIESHFSHDLNLAYRVTRGLEVGVGLYNVVDDDAVEADRVPREPRVVLGRVSYRFSPGPSLPEEKFAEREPAELGRARAAVERARAAGAEALNLTSYREALAHLAIAEQLHRKGESRSRVAAAAELSMRAADVARQAAADLGGAPPAPPPTVAPSPPAPAPKKPPATPPTKRVPPGAAAAATPPKQVPMAATPGVATPRATAPMATATAALPTLPPSPTSTPTISVSKKHVLLLQSDGGVAIYRDTAARLAASLPGEVELHDLHGDREQAVELLRGASADLIVAVGSLAATVARQSITDRPVLFCAVLNPGRYDLAAPNVGGVSFEISAAAQLERLKAALPGATRVGVIYDPAKSAAIVAEAERVAPRFGLQIVKAVAQDPRSVDFVFRSLRKDIDVLWVIPDSTVITRESFEVLALQAAETKTPFVAFAESFARQGALLAFYPDPAAIGEQCAGIAAKVLRGEAGPGQIGIRSPDRFRVAINRRVEDQLGIEIGSGLRPDVEIR